jgi:hypothetical protein
MQQCDDTAHTKRNEKNKVIITSLQNVSNLDLEASEKGHGLLALSQL